MTYEILITDPAKEELKELKKDDPKSFEKAIKLLDELRLHPFSGTGKPEVLRFITPTVWSRRISKKHRLVYQIKGDKLIVTVLSAKGHYGDK